MAGGVAENVGRSDTRTLLRRWGVLSGGTGGATVGVSVDADDVDTSEPPG